MVSLYFNRTQSTIRLFLQANILIQMINTLLVHKPYFDFVIYPFHTPHLALPLLPLNYHLRNENTPVAQSRSTFQTNLFVSLNASFMSFVITTDEKHRWSPISDIPQQFFPALKVAVQYISHSTVKLTVPFRFSFRLKQCGLLLDYEKYQRYIFTTMRVKIV